MSLIKTFSEVITTSGYKAVELPTDISKIHGLGMWTEDKSDYYIAEDDTGTGEVLVPDGMPIAPRFFNTLRFGSGSVVLCYVKGTTPTNISGLVI